LKLTKEDVVEMLQFSEDLKIEAMDMMEGRKGDLNTSIEE
jgi:hypothetical protein